MLVSNVGYSDVSAYRFCVDVGVYAGNSFGIWSGPSAVRSTRFLKSHSSAGGLVSETLHIYRHLSDSCRQGILIIRQRSFCDTYQQPPAFSLRSKTRMISNAFSCAKASTAIAPAGPAPMIAILFAGTSLLVGLNVVFNRFLTSDLRSYGCIEIFIYFLSGVSVTRGQRTYIFLAECFGIRGQQTPRS